jgi:hypothetical protein
MGAKEVLKEDLSDDDVDFESVDVDEDLFSDLHSTTDN